VNLIVAEISLLLGSGMQDLQSAHWTSEKNVLADRLSRMAVGDHVPEEFVHTERAEPPRAAWTLLHI